MKNAAISRNKFIVSGTSLLLTAFAIPVSARNEDDKALIAHEIKVLGEMVKSESSFLWNILAGVTEQELDWKPNAESNSIRWVIGHLCWFEEWLADAVGDRKGRYLTDKKPISVNDVPYEKVKSRFEAAQTQSTSIITSLSPAQLDTPVSYLGRFDIPIRYLPRVHAEHLSGHLYQIRYIRGTYSRVFKTNKALFDPW